MKKNSLLGNKCASFFWGLGEATFFFIVPDVLLSYVALKNFKSAFVACLLATAGALLGGVVLYAWACQDMQAATNFLNTIPGISARSIDHARLLMQRNVFLGMLQGAFSGIPYKIFSVQAAAIPVPLSLFLAYSVPARLVRFVAVIGLTTLIRRIFLKNVAHRKKLVLLICSWSIFYGIYFSLMGW